MIFKILLIVSYFFNICYCGMEEQEGVKYANRCEATELESRLEETGKTHEVLDFGYSVDDVKPKRRQKYQKSELRLVESLDGLCERVLQYNIHKERQDSTRFDKGMSQTFQTLHGLVDKGVKVELGIPYELWDKPSAEITNMKTQCETLLEENEDAIEDWYFNHQGEMELKQFICSEKALKGESDMCLDEQFPSLKQDATESNKKENKKKDKKRKQKEDSDDSEEQFEDEIKRHSQPKGDFGDDEKQPKKRTKGKEEL
ncbi:Protein canopy 3 [Blattella germanica]|nr:Protein canopy 3 [Blattella germanica]